MPYAFVAATNAFEVSLATWLVVVFVTFFASFFMSSAILIGGGEFIVHINEALQAIGVGIIIGLATREIRIKVTSNEASQQPE